MSKPSFLPLMCANAAMGSYEGQLFLQDPWGRKVGIDACLAAEVATLWNHGIRTIESCCGHGVAASYIAVEEQYIGQMKALRYVPSPSRPPGFFFSRSSQHGLRATRNGRASEDFPHLAAKARAEGKSTYHGKPCKTCGGTERKSISGKCVNAQRAWHLRKGRL